jgi:hypothetical protein
MLDSVGGAKVATCMDADFPSLGEPPNRDRVCFGGDNISALYLYGLTERRNFGADATYEIDGETSARVAQVAVTYKGAAGKQVGASGSYGLITSKVARATGIRHRAGQFIAFLPASAVPPGESPSDALSDRSGLGRSIGTGEPWTPTPGAIARSRPF